MKAVISTSFLPLFLLCFLSAQAWAIQSKGAIIIASMEGDVSVTNNETGVALSADRVKVGGLIFDGHTVSTGPASKAVLLFSSGTITTLKADSVLNIKKFAQEKFDPKAAGKLGERKDEPSPSETVIDLNLGDMVVDVKKLKKESSFNIDSPVGTAGIRGTVPAIQVLKLPDGGFTQNTSMLRGEIAFTPRAGGPATFLGPGQSLSIGIGANGLMLPAQLGRVDVSVMKAIEAEVEQAAAVSGAAPADNEPSGKTPQGASEEDAPSEDELNESDDERQASAKGVGGDENSTDAVALEKAGLIDLDDPEQLAKADDFVEVAVKSADSFGFKQEKEAEIKKKEAELDAKESKIKELEAQLEVENGRRADDSGSLLAQINALKNEVESLNTEVSEEKENIGKGSSDFVKVLGENLESTVDVIIEAESLGIKSDDLNDLIEKTAENAENAPITNSNMAKVKDAGVEDLGALQSLISSPENSDEAAEFIDEALKADPTEGSSAAVTKLGAVARSTSVADKMKEAKDEGIDPDTIIDSAVAVADLEIQAEKQQAELISSGPEIDPALISLINNAPDEASINAVLEGKENESFYDKLAQLGESRLRAIELQNNKTKISTTIKAADSRNKNIEKKRQEAEQLKGGIPADVIIALEEADISSSDKVIALKAQYEELYKSEVTTLESISNYIDKLKSAYDLENKDLTSFVEDVNTLETIFTATADNEDFDISDSLIQIEEVAETFELLQSDGEETDKEFLEAAANLAQNANEIQESKKLLTVAKDEGIDLNTLAKKDIKEQKAINKAVEDQKKSVEKQRLEKDQLAGTLSPELLATLDSKDVSGDSSVDTILEDYLGDPSYADIEKYINARRKAYKLENTDLTKLAETSETLAVLYESTADNTDFDITDSLAEIEEVQATFELLSVDGKIDVNDFDAEAASNIAANAADIKDSREAIQLAKDAGIDVNEVAKKDIEEQKAIKNVATKIKEAGGGGDAGDEAVKKFLASGATEDVLQYEQALEEDPELAGEIAEAVTETPDNGEADVSAIDLKAKIDEKVQGSVGGKLKAEYAQSEYLSIIEQNEARAQDISYALSFVEKDSAQEKALFENIDKLDAIISLGSRFKDDDEKLTSVFNNLDYANALNELVEEFKNQPSRIDLIFENPELSPAVLSAYKDFKDTGSQALINDLFKDSDSMKTTLSNDGINKLRQKYPQYDTELTKYEDRAGEINALLEQFESNEIRINFILSNLDSFDAIKGLTSRFEASEQKLEIIFTYEGDLKQLKEISDRVKSENLIGGQDLIFANPDLVPLFLHDIGYLSLSKNHSEFIRLIESTQISLFDVPSALASELATLGLNKEELTTVLNDLLNGPNADAPQTSPIDEEKSSSPEFATLSFLLDHEFSGQIREDLVISSELAFASSFFQEVLDVVDALIALSETPLAYTPADSQILDSLDSVEISSTSSNQSVSGANASPSLGVLGGRNITVGAGTYDLSLLNFQDILFTSTNQMTLSGELIFNVNDSNPWNSLNFVSAGGLSFAKESSISYGGGQLGFGAFDTFEIVEVDLYAMDSITASSLDSIVINNSAMETSGRGSDFVHLLAYNELAVNNLAFSEQIRQITMEAMTINLYNLNFPNGSMVKLNSQYGGIDGKYPNFNSSVYGRVNFVENIRYSSNLIMDRPSFDQYGTNVTIGQLGQ